MAPQHVWQLRELATNSSCHSTLLHADVVRILASLLADKCALTCWQILFASGVLRLHRPMLLNVVFSILHALS
jgi:hypothetical protein